MSDLLASLERAITTAVNDDDSAPLTPERARVAERLAAMSRAAAALRETRE